MNKPPDVLYLQFYGDSDPALELDGPVSEGDVTWSKERVFDYDVRYVRVEDDRPKRQNVKERQ